MSLKLIAPGKRGNKFWYVRGRINGKLIEASTFSTDKKDAEKRKAELEHTLLTVRPATDYKDFGYAAQRYIAWRNPSKLDLRNIDRLIAKLGRVPLIDMTQSDMTKVADIFFPVENFKASTRNRAIVRPFSAIMHYANENGWCAYMRVRSFKEPTALTRFTSREVEKKLLLALRGQPMRKALVLWCYRQGDRISDTLKIKYEDCDFEAMTIRRHIGKTDRYVTMPLDDTLGRYFRARARSGSEGYLFPWQTRGGVYRWLRPLTKKLKIAFTPHMGRHTIGKRMVDANIAVRSIMDKLGHQSVNSSMRYQSAGVESVRQASKKIKTVGKTVGKR